MRDGLARGWNVIDASSLARDVTLEADVAIVGTGAGGGIAAEILADAGLRVRDGRGRTAQVVDAISGCAKPTPIRDLYQESAARKTADKAINILQGRCVGGGTTVNWTSSFRTPAATLAHWQSAHGWSPARRRGARALVRAGRGASRHRAVADRAERQQRRARARRRALGLHRDVIRRNVRGCWNLGYCGMGCPTNAKQSMLVTTIPHALDARRDAGDARARAALRHARRRRRRSSNARRWTRAARRRRHGASSFARASFVAAAGAIGSPALLLRSGVPDPYATLGVRTFLHPTVVSAALMPARVDGFAGAPQTIYSDQFMTRSRRRADRLQARGAAVHPVLAAITLPGHGVAHAPWMRRLPNMQVLIALLRDGFHPDSAGGRVRLAADGTPLLDYPLTPYVFEGVRRAMTAMAEIQFAAGATTVMPVHDEGDGYASVRRGARGDRRIRPAPARDDDRLGARDGRLRARAGSAPRRRRRDGSASSSREPARAGRLALSDVDRRQSAAVDLRVDGEARDGRSRSAHCARDARRV